MEILFPEKNVEASHYSYYSNSESGAKLRHTTGMKQKMCINIFLLIKKKSIVIVMKFETGRIFVSDRVYRGWSDLGPAFLFYVIPLSIARFED